MLYYKNAIWLVKIVIKLLYLSNQSELFHGSKTILCLNLLMISALVIFIHLLYLVCWFCNLVNIVYWGLLLLMIITAATTTNSNNNMSSSNNFAHPPNQLSLQSSTPWLGPPPSLSLPPERKSEIATPHVMMKKWLEQQTQCDQIWRIFATLAKP